MNVSGLFSFSSTQFSVGFSFNGTNSLARKGLIDFWPSSLQVRGFLSVHKKFPLSEEEAKNTTLQHFQTLAKAAYRQSGDRSVVKRQRQLAMLEAYHSVPRSLLAQVQSSVAEDCELFGYECSIEIRFNVSTRPEPLFHYDEILSNQKVSGS